MKHSENNSLYALSISHHSHRASSSPDFTKRSFDEVGGSQTAPKFRLVNLKEVKQLIEIAFQTSHSLGIVFAPARGESPLSLGRFSLIGSIQRWGRILG